MRVLRIITLCLVLVAAASAIVMNVVLPVVVGREVRARLHTAGYPDARFAVGTVALDRVELLDVSLQRGLALGDVVIEAGPYQLWRGERATVVVRGAEIAVETPLARQTGGSLPFDRVVIEDAHVSAGGDRIAVRGAIDLRGRDPVLDLVADAPILDAGTVGIERFAATVRGPLGALRACVTGTVRATQLDACATGDARELQTAEVSWAASGPELRATGHGWLRRSGGAVLLDNARIDASVASTTAGGVSFENATLHADVAADLTAGTFHLAGALHADEVAARSVVLRDVSLPVALDGSGYTALVLHSAAPLVMTAKDATITTFGRSMRIERPVLRGTGELELAGFALAAQSADAPFEIATTVRGVPLDPLVSMATRDRARATGVLDGELVFGLDEDGLSLAKAALATRSAGTLRTKELDGLPAEGFAVHERVAAALADFAYSRLTLSVDEPSTLRLSLVGRGQRVTQDLAVDINVRGLFARKAVP